MRADLDLEPAGSAMALSGSTVLSDGVYRTKEYLSLQLLDVVEHFANAPETHSAIDEVKLDLSLKSREDVLLEAVEEHLEIKRVIADLLALDAADETFDAKVKVLKEDVEHHVEEEETILFPKVKKILDEELLATVGAAMEQTEGELLEAGNPRNAVPAQTENAAPV